MMFRRGNGNGTFGSPVTFATTSNGAWGGVIIGDLNNDTVLDALVAGTDGSTAQFTVHLGNTRAGIGPQLDFDLTTVSGARSALSQFATNRNLITAQRAEIGAFQSRLLTAFCNTETIIENYAGAESRIRDVDVAQVFAQQLAQRILQQADTAILAQANIQPQVALQLLQD